MTDKEQPAAVVRSVAHAFHCTHNLCICVDVPYSKFQVRSYEQSKRCTAATTEDL